MDTLSLAILIILTNFYPISKFEKIICHCIEFVRIINKKKSDTLFWKKFSGIFWKFQRAKNLINDSKMIIYGAYHLWKFKKFSFIPAGDERIYFSKYGCNCLRRSEGKKSKMFVGAFASKVTFKTIFEQYLSVTFLDYPISRVKGVGSSYEWRD